MVSYFLLMIVCRLEDGSIMPEPREKIIPINQSDKEKQALVEAFAEMAPDYERTVDAELNRFWGWSYASFLEELFTNTPIKDNDVVLDLATGTGVISHHLAKAGVTRAPIHALDITYGMLLRARQRFSQSGLLDRGRMVCASALDMPYCPGHFSLVICGLATHHMDVDRFINECHRILETGGRLSIIDAGGSIFWKVPGVRLLLRIAAYIYFIITENHSRAWAESSAVSHVHTKEEWEQLLAEKGFNLTEVRKLKSKYPLVPSPLLIKAVKG